MMEKREKTPAVSHHRTSAALKDLIWLGIIFFFLLFAAFQMDLFEQVENVLERYDHYEIDEFIIVQSIFSIFISLYAYRRWREMKNSLKKRMMSDDELRQANSDLMRKTNELKVHNQWNEKLSKLANFLQVCKSRDEVFDFISQAAAQLFKETRGALYMTRESRNQLVKVAGWGDPSATPDFFSPDDCWGLRLGKLYAARPGSDNPACQHAAGIKNNSHFCIPLTAYGEIIGLFHVDISDETGKSKNEPTPQPTEKLAASFAEQISLAISNLTLHDKLRDLAIHDPLTGLYNRQYLQETFERELHRAKRNKTRIGVIMIDLDHFKQFNDSFGHAAGDLLLQELGRLLKGFFRIEDFCCRFGGEEFLILLSEVTESDLKKRSEMLRQRISELNVSYLDQPLGKITGSLGVALFPDNGETYSQVLKAVDEALYHAKNSGRDRVCFSRINNQEKPDGGVMPGLLSEQAQGSATGLRA